MPPDHTSTWERQPLGRDKFERPEDKYGPARKDWPSDRPHRSSIVNGSLPSSLSKRRPQGSTGWHECTAVNGRYNFAADRQSEPLCATSSSEDGTVDRDGVSSCGGSPVFGLSNSSLSTDKPCKAYDGQPCLSPADGRPASTPKLVSGRLYGVFEGFGSREKGRSRFASSYCWDTLPRSQSCREFPYKSDSFRRADTFPRVGSSRVPIEGDFQPEGRLDRYGSALNKEQSAFDASNAQSDHDWSAGDKLSSSPASSRCFKAEPALQHEQDRLVVQMPPKTSFVGILSPQKTGHEDVELVSPRKKPRLTWGQGLAKYEQGKTEEDPAVSQKSEKDSIGDCTDVDKGEPNAVGLLSCVFEKCDEQQTLGSGPLLSNIFSACEEQSPKRTLEIFSCGNLNSLKSVNLVETENCKDSAAFFTRPEESASGIFKSSALICQSSVVTEVQTLLASYQNDTSSVSKGALTQLVEKLEFEIDVVEKEILKLENDDECSIQTIRKKDVYIPATCDATLSGTDMSNKRLEAVPSLISPSKVTSIDTAATRDETALSVYGQGAGQLRHADAECSGSKVVAARTMPNKFHNDAVCLPDPASQSMNAQESDEKEVTTGKDLNVVLCLLQENHKMADQASYALAHLMPVSIASDGSITLSSENLYSRPSGASVWEFNKENYEKKRKFFELKVAERKYSIKFVEALVAVKYRMLRGAWKQGQAGRDKMLGQPKTPWECVKGDCKSCLYMCDKSCVQHYCKSENFETDTFFCMTSLRHEREYLRMPSMLLDKKEHNFNRFDTKNGLVEDPVAAERERTIVNPWTREERKLFLDKYSLYGKDFRTIASFLVHKSVADCVEYYYRNQKSEEFEKVHRRHQLRKRRDCTRSNASYLSTATIASRRRRRESNHASAEGLTLMAAAAAAMGVQRDVSGVVQSSSKMELLQDNHRSKQLSNLMASLGQISHDLVGGKGSRSMHYRIPKGPKVDADPQWTDDERELFVGAVAMFGKDFRSIAQYVGSKSQGQCRTFFNRRQKQLGLDLFLERYEMPLEEGSVDAMKQVPGPEDLKLLEQVEEVAKGSCRTKILDVKGAQTHVSDEPLERHSVCPVVPLTISSNIPECPVVSMTDPKDDTLAHDTMSAAKSMETTTGEMHGLLSDNADVCETGAIEMRGLLPDADVGGTLSGAPYDNVKEEISPVDTGGTVTDSNMVNQPVVDATQCCSEVDSLACQEVLQFKAEPVDGTVGCSEASGAAFSLDPMLSSVIPRLVVPNPPTVASIAKLGDVKSRIFKTVDSRTRREPTSWNQDEKDKFFDVIRNHGKDWVRLCESLPAKSLTQIKTYFQNSKAKLHMVPDSVSTINSNVGMHRKRKLDKLDSMFDAGFAGQSTSSKVFISSDSSMLTSSGGLRIKSIDVDSLTCKSDLGCSSSQSLGDSINISEVFHQNGTRQNLTATGSIQTYNMAAGFSSGTSSLIQHSVFSSTPLEAKCSVNSQVPNQFPSTVSTQTLQQQVGVQQTNHKQQQQQAQPVSKHSLLPLNSKPSGEPQQVIQQLQQHVAEAVLKQQMIPHLVQMQPQQQLQLGAQQLSQMLAHHQAQSHEQSLPQVVKQKLQSSNHCEAPPQLTISDSRNASSQLTISDSRHASSQVDRIGQLQPPFYTSSLLQQINPSSRSVMQAHPSSQTFLQQQTSQQLFQQLQLHVQEQKLLMSKQSQRQRQGTENSPLLQQSAFHGFEVRQQQAVSGASQTQQTISNVCEGQQQQQVALTGVNLHVPASASDIHTHCCVSEIPATKFHKTSPGNLQQSLIISQGAVGLTPQSSLEVQVRGTDVKLFGQSLLSQPAVSFQRGSSSLQSPPATCATPTSLTVAKSGLLTLPKSYVSCGDNTGKTGPGDLPKPYETGGEINVQGCKWQQAIPSGSMFTNMSGASTKGKPKVADTVAAACLMASGLKPDTIRMNNFTKKELEMQKRCHIDDLSLVSQSMQDGRDFVTLGGHVSVLAEGKRVDKDSRTHEQFVVFNQGASLGKNRGQDLSSFAAKLPGSHIATSHNLPHVLDALVALAEWRLQNPSNGRNKLTEEFLTQSWEALQRDPGSLVEASKTNGSLAPQFRDGFGYCQPSSMHFRTCIGGGRQSISNFKHLNGDTQNPTGQSSLCSHSGPLTLIRSEEFELIEVQDGKNKSGAVI